MAGSIVETTGSRSFSGTTITYKFAVYNTTDEAEVVTLVEGLAPTSVGGNPAGTATATKKGFDFWEIEVPYAAARIEGAATGVGEDPGPQGGTEGGGNPAGEGVNGSAELGREISFSTGGGTQQIYQAKEHIKSFVAAGFAAPDHKGAINVTGNEVAGVEIKSSSGVVILSKRLPVITLGYFLRLLAMTATTNDKPWRGFGKCEMLLAGADGSFKGTAEGWSLVCKFDYEKSDFNITFGDATDADHHIKNVEKLGHHYMWVERESVEDAAAVPKRMVMRPFAVHVERVYDESDFDVLGL